MAQPIAMKARLSLLQQCLDDAISRAPGMLARCLDHMIAEHLASVSPGREVKVIESCSPVWMALMRHKMVWGQRLVLRLRALTERPDDAATSRMGLMGDSSLLALLDEADQLEQVAFRRTLQAVATQAEPELAALDARMGPLLEGGRPARRKNPLRPSVFLGAIRELMLASEPDPAVRAQWLRALAEPLARELRALYSDLAAILQQSQAGGYHVRLVHDTPVGKVPDEAPATGHGLLDELFDLPGMPRPPRAPAPAPVDGTGGDHTELARLHSTLEPSVFDRFLQDDDPYFDQPLGSEYRMALARERAMVEEAAQAYRHDEAAVLAARHRHQGLAAVDRPTRQVGVDSVLSEADWGEMAYPDERARVLLELKAQASEVSQAVGLDMVRLMVGQVASDPLLLAPVREAVVALEPALLRLVLPEPRYFHQQGHAARAMVEHISARSFRYNDEFSPEFAAFFAPVRDAINALNAMRIDHPLMFAHVLADLMEAWAQEDRAEMERRQAGLQTVQRADRRQARALEIARTISQRPDIEGAPAFVLEFLYGPWALALAEAEIANPAAAAAEAAQHDKTLSDLLWSIRKDDTLNDPARLFRLLPGLLQGLQRGLHRLGQSPEEGRAFFDALMHLHEPALGLLRARKRVQAKGLPLGAAPVAIEPEPVNYVEPEPATPEERTPRAAESPWLAVAEQEAAGFEDTLPTQPQALEASTLAPDTLVASDEVTETQAAQGTPDEVLDGLSTGDWVDLYSHREWLRAELVWVNPKRTLFMFVSQGGQTHSMTRRICLRLVQDRLLRPVGVPGAILQTARVASATVSADRLVA